MKIRFSAALLIAALIFTLFTGCGAVTAEPTPQAASPTVAIPAPPVPQAPAPQSAIPAPSEVSAPTAPVSPAPESSRITKEEAIAIALQDAGLTADQVTRLRAEFDYDDGRPEYDVDFHQGGYEYDYEIHAETGKILSKDKDWDD